MSKSEKTTATTPSNESEHPSIVDALFDVGTAWVELGIGYGKVALQSSAKVLEQTAKALETLQDRLKSDDDQRAA
jgi:hypothetical protein